MAKSPQIIADAAGLQTQPNELTLPAGSLSVGENVEITRDGIVEVARGFKDFSSNLPDFTPEQLLVVGGVAYLNLDSGLWYYDTASGNWLRKTGSLGTSPRVVQQAVYVSGHVYATTLNGQVVFDYDLSAGTRTVLAGRYLTGGTADGTGDTARFTSPIGICSDGTNLYVCDSGNYTIRKIVIATGAVSTIAGSAGSSSTTDGLGTAARFKDPVCVCTDGTNLFVTDQGAGIRKIRLSDNNVTTLVFSGFSFSSSIYGICTDGTSIYVTDNALNCVVQAPVSGGAATAIAGSSGTSGSLDGTGSAARFNGPAGVCLNSDKTALYLVEVNNNTLRKVLIPSGVVSTECGTAGSSGSADGIGTAVRFAVPTGICFDGSSFYICDSNNNALRKVYPSARYCATIDGTQTNAIFSPGIPRVNGFVAGPT